MSASLKTRTNFAFLFAMSVLATMGWLAFQESRRLADKDRLVTKTREVLGRIESLRGHFVDAGTARRVYILLGDASRLPAFESESSACLADLSQLHESVSDQPEQLSRLQDIEPLVRTRLSTLKSSVELHQRTSNDTKQQEIVTEEGAKLSAEFADKLREFENVEKNLLQERVTGAEVVYRSAIRTIELLVGSVLSFMIIGVAVLNRELFRRSQAEHAIGRERKLLESILNSCSDAVIVADETAKIILRNPAAEKLYQGVSALTLSEDYSQKLGLYQGDGVTPFATRDLPLVRTLRGESVDGQEMYVLPPGQTQGHYLLAAGRPLLDDRGERRGGLVFLRDITERKREGERLNAALLESERNARERSELNRLADLFQSCQGVDEAFKVVAAFGPRLFESRPGALCLTNSSRTLVETVARWNDCSTSKDAFDPAECWALRLGKPYAGEEGGPALRCAHLTRPAGAYLCLPLMAQGETYGVLYVEDKPMLPGVASDNSHLQSLARGIAEHISLAVANLKLRDILRNQSIRDPLTGLFNRRYLEESLDRELHRASRTHRSVCVVMLDLDHFKQFNDTFGHQAGDLLLREVALAIKARVRAGDLACRYGGEEFAIIVAETDTNGATICVDKIREAVRQLSLQFRGQNLGSVTLSAGIAAFPAHGDNPEDLIHMADGALYRAKREGRDRIVICEEHERVGR